MGRFHRNDHLRLMHSGLFEVQHDHVFRTGLPVFSCFLFAFLKWWLLFLRVFTVGHVFVYFRSTSLISFFARFPRSPHFFSCGFWMANKQTHNSPRILEPHGYNRFSPKVGTVRSYNPNKGEGPEGRGLEEFHKA